MAPVPDTDILQWYVPHIHARSPALIVPSG